MLAAAVSIAPPAWTKLYLVPTRESRRIHSTGRCRQRPCNGGAARNADRFSSCRSECWCTRLRLAYAMQRFEYRPGADFSRANERNERNWSPDRAPKQAIKLNFGLETSDRHAWVAFSRGRSAAERKGLGQLLRRRAPSVRPPRNWPSQSPCGHALAGL